MAIGSIDQAVKLVNSSASVNLQYNYYFASSLPSYASGVTTPLYTTVGASGYVLSASDFMNLTSTSEAAASRSFSAFASISGVSVNYLNSSEADIVISGLNVQLYNADGDSVAAFAYQPIGSHPLRSDVFVLQNGATSAEIFRSVQHELSHSLGLLDVLTSGGPLYTGIEDSGRYTIMSYQPHPGTGQSVHELQLYDVAAIQSIYGRNDTYNSSNTVINNFIETATPFAGQDRAFAIWDGGGNDTIDASSLSTAALIDLRPGHFSSIGNSTTVSVSAGNNPILNNAGQLNISIAYGAYIENAIGTTENDFLIGNLLSNALEGGDGDDVIYAEGSISSYDPADGSYTRVSSSSPSKTESPSPEVQKFVSNPRAQIDILRGDAGNDYLHDGRGDDTLVGGADDDTLIASQGNDILWGGEYGVDTPGDNDAVNYLSSKPVSITFDGSSETPTLTVRDGDGGKDSLHSIEKVVGTLANDQLQVLGAIPTGTTLTIDANGGQGPNPADSINLKGAASGTQLTLNGSGTGSIQTNGGGQINLLGFHTQIIGSDYDDEISDDSSGQKRIDGRDGDDVISVTGTSSNVTLIGGSGSDTLVGGAGNDIIIADGNDFWVNEDNDIYGGAGSDFIVSASVGNVIDGGDGADYIKLNNSFSPTGSGPYRGLYIAGGEGNDVIDAAGNMGFTLNFAANDGHDTIISTVTTESSSIDLHFSDLAPEDLTFKWDVPNDGNFHTGDLAIIVNSTGASIFIPQVRGYVGTGDQLHTQYWLQLSIDQLTLDTRDGYHVEFGDVSEYNLGSLDFDQATALSLGETEGTSGDDNLSGASGDDSLSGGDGDDNFTASYGNDTIDGGNGDDSVSLVGSRTDYTIARNGEDLVVTSLRATEGEMTLISVESIYFLSDGDSYSHQDIFGYMGTSGADTIIGSYLNNVIDAQAGNDTIFGLEGDDTIDGGDGYDVVYYAGSASDYQIYKDWYGSFIVLSAASEARMGRLSNVESIHFEGSDTTTALTDQTLAGTSGIDALTGGYGDDGLTGLAGNDILVGGGGSDSIDGGDDDDRLSGGTGDDIIDGGDGYDIAEFAGLSTGYVVAREPDGALSVANWYSEDDEGYDTLTNVEELYFAGDNTTLTLNDIPQLGTGSNDVLSGSERPDALLGFAGDDSLSGGGGSDELDGGEGADTMVGGEGDDYFYVDNAGDAVFENLDQGYDSVESSVSFTIGSNIENLYLTGENAIDGTGNSLGNYISGNDYDNALSGLAGNDELDGSDGDDVLTGGNGDDQLDGGDGSDTSVYTGYSNDYTISTVDGEIQITDDMPSVDGDDGTDILYEIEKAEFSDKTISLAAPIVLDLDGDGVELIDRMQSNTMFDWDDDGKTNRTGWIGKDDGLLVFDRNGDGRVSDSSELSFVGDKKSAKSDLDGLTAFDSNDDGIFSVDDDQFAEFRIWRDKNGNGKSDKHELMTLEQAGIASITLAGTAVNQNWGWEDNLIINNGTFARIDGSQGTIADVALNYSVPRATGAASSPAAIQRTASRLAEAIATFGAGRGMGDIFAQQNWVDKREMLFAVSDRFDLR